MKIQGIDITDNLIAKVTSQYLDLISIYVKDKVCSLKFDNEVEVDETFLYKSKKGHHGRKIKSVVYILGFKQR
jgi:hypothetical protein